MKLIDLLNKIAKGEEVPKKIKIGDDELYFSKYKNTYVFEDGGDLNWCYYVTHKILNNEVEILEEKPKHIEELDIVPLDVEYAGLSSTERATRSNVNEIHKKVDELSKAVNYLLDKEEK